MYNRRKAPCHSEAPVRQKMMRSLIRLVLSIFLFLLPVCVVVRAQSEKTAQQIAEENQKADLTAFQRDWTDQCKTAFDNAKPVAGLHMLTGPTSGYYYMAGKAISSVVAA